MSLALKIIPPIQFIVSASLMFTLNYYLPQYKFNFPEHLSIILILITVAGILGVLALHDFHKHKTTHHPHTPEKTSTVVDSGIYAYSRNPMYLALVLLLLALAFFFTNIACFAVILLFIGYITQYQIKPEEEMLDKLFPVAYQAYSQKVRRWF